MSEPASSTTAEPGAPDAADSRRFSTPTEGITQPGGFLVGRFRLSTQLVLLAAFTVGIALAGSFLALERRLAQTARQRLTSELGRTQATLLRLERRDLAQLLWTASILGETPTLRAAIATERHERARATPRMRRELLATVKRAAEVQHEAVAADLLVVTDADGRMLAASARNATVPLPGTALGDVPAVRRALDPEAPVDSGNVGVAQLAADYYLAAAAPIVLDGFTIGTVILGQRVDQGYVRRLQTAFDGEVEVRAANRVVGSTLPASMRAPAPTLMPESGTVGTLTLAGEDYVAAVLSLGRTAQGEEVEVWMLRPVGRTVRELTGAFGRDFLLVGAAALLLAVLGAVLAARAILEPLHKVVTLMREGARTGVVRRTATPAAAPREIRWLADSYGQLAKALDVEREAVQRRTEQLEATNADLTQQVRERVRVESALHEREEQLRQAQKLEALGTLAGGVAHDFNNLLTVISGFTQLAIARADEPVREDLQQVKDAAHRAGELTAQLLAFGRKQVLRPHVLDLNETVQRMEKMLRRVVGSAVELRMELDPQLARVHADPGQLEQVLMNLTINARDAMPDGGTLVIGTSNVRRDKGDPGIALSVRDTGTGMDAATRARVFEPFFTTKELGKGTGLGLATVYGIVQQSGGSISVDSRPGRGSTFRIVLPAVPAAEGSGFVTPAEQPVPRGAETVLLVEDEPALRSLAARVLEAHGYRVLQASEGAEALLLAERCPDVIDLLVTDVVMPRMTGREVARRMLLSRQETRVLYMSGHAPDAVGGASAFAGAAFLAKPFTPEQLARAVRDALDAESTSATVTASAAR